MFVHDRARLVDVLKWSFGSVVAALVLGALLLSALLLASAARASAAERWFQRGDVDQDGIRSVTDPIQTLQFLLAAGEIACLDAADIDDNGEVEIADPVLLLGHLFDGGRPIRPPFASCGPDSIPDDLTCDGPTFCAPDFYGFPLDADLEGVFFVVDRSAPMQNSGELDMAQTEIAIILEALGEDVEFGAVFFDRDVITFPASGLPAPATDELKESGVAWLRSFRGGGGSCVREGLLAAMEMARSSTATRKAVFYIGDGGGTCNGQNESAYLEQSLAVVGENLGRDTVVNTIGVLEIGALQKEFLERLAGDTGGEHLRVVR